MRNRDYVENQFLIVDIFLNSLSPFADYAIEIHDFSESAGRPSRERSLQIISIFAEMKKTV